MKTALPASIALVGTLAISSPTYAARFIPPTVNPSDGFPQTASEASALEMGSDFLNRLAKNATWGYALRGNPGGGGASSTTAPLSYRNWFELYGQSAKTDAQGTYVGDSRRTIGGVAGFGATIAPGINLGASIDQSHSKIDLPLAAENGRFNLTQLGVNASFEKGPWMLAIAAVHGFGTIDTSRSNTLGIDTANFHARLDGALAELSYYWGFGQARIVPKAAIEYTRAVTDAFSETGPLAVSVDRGTGERTRVLFGAEIGQYWIINQHILDLSAYGKFVDNVDQNMSPVTFTNGFSTLTAQGLTESRYGADAGATASLSLTQAVRVYLTYDGKYRENFRSHNGTAGLEVKW